MDIWESLSILSMWGVDMLKIHFGALEGQIKRPDIYFDLVCRDDWFSDPFVREICLGIDKTIVHSRYQMENPNFGPVNSTMLSTGCKNTILAYKLDRIIPATHMGDNCAPYVFAISKNKDLTITLEYIMDFSKCENFEAEILNCNQKVTNYFDYVCMAGEFLF